MNLNFTKSLLTTPPRKIIAINLLATASAILLIGSFQYFFTTQTNLPPAQEHLPHFWPSIILSSLILLMLNGVGLFYMRLVCKRTAESEEYFRQIYEKTPLPYQSIDENGLLADVNQAWLSTLGYEKDDVVGKPFQTFLLPESAEYFKNNFPQFKAAGRTITAEIGMVKNDGSSLLASFTCESIQSASGHFQKTHCISHDITKQKENEKAILQARKEWERTFDAITDIVTIQDMDMHITRINKTGQEAFGRTFDGIIGRHCYEFFHGGIEPCPECPLLVIKESFAPYTKIMAHEKLGKIFLVSASPVLDENGQLTHIAHVTKDITEQKKMEEQLFLNEKLVTIAGLAAGVAHEINTPLSAILQSLQLIEMSFSPDDPDSREKAAECNVNLSAVQNYLKKNEIDFFIDGIRQSALKAGSIIKNLLEFSRPNTGSFSSTILEEIIDNSLLLSMADYSLKKKYDIMNVTINKEYAADPIHIICVAMEIEQVLLNIIKNSVQAMADSGQKEKSCLTLRTSTKAEMAVIEIEDNGPGMTEDIKKHIFDPFYTTKEIGTGTGLGLSVTHTIIVNKHHGKLLVESEPGQGTKFIIELPLTTED